MSGTTRCPNFRPTPLPLIRFIYLLAGIAIGLRDRKGTHLFLSGKGAEGPRPAERAISQHSVKHHIVVYSVGMQIYTQFRLIRRPAETPTPGCTFREGALG